MENCLFSKLVLRPCQLDVSFISHLSQSANDVIIISWLYSLHFNTQVVHFCTFDILFSVVVVKLLQRQTGLPLCFLEQCLHDLSAYFLCPSQYQYSMKRVSFVIRDCLVCTDWLKRFKYISMAIYQFFKASLFNNSISIVLTTDWSKLSS